MVKMAGRVVFWSELKGRGLKDESTDTFCQLVHFVRAVLAHRTACPDSVSGGLALGVTLPVDRYHGQSTVCFNSGIVVSASPATWMEE
jgi:hypothetical protein